VRRGGYWDLTWNLVHGLQSAQDGKRFRPEIYALSFPPPKSGCLLCVCWWLCCMITGRPLHLSLCFGHPWDSFFSFFMVLYCLCSVCLFHFLFCFKVWFCVFIRRLFLLFVTKLGLLIFCFVFFICLFC